MPNELKDNILILYNDAKDREEDALFRHLSGEPIKHSGGLMFLTFDLPQNAEKHKDKSYSHIYAHSRVEKLKSIFPGIPVTHYSCELKTWYAQAIDKIKNVPRENTDEFIETVLEQFKQILVLKSHEQLAKYCLTIFERQLRWFEDDFTQYLKKKYRTLNGVFFDDVDVIDFFQSLSPSQKQEIKSKVSAAESHEMIGEAQVIKDLREQITRIAQAGKKTVLILGETGVGKELVAKAIHEGSPRKQKEMVIVNCAAIQSGRAVSELFGHVKGAFTGADKDRNGKFKTASDSTLFLDEIGELPLDVQAMLLRVFETGSFYPDGSDHAVTVNVRVIAATNKNLKDKSIFREDLFSRLDALTINVPPLREHLEDIPILANYFIGSYGRTIDKPFEGITEGAKKKLVSHVWSRNIRELKNVIERAVIFGTPPWIQEQDILLNTSSTTAKSSLSTCSPHTSEPASVRLKCEEECQEYSKYLSDGRTLAEAQEEYNRARAEKKQESNNSHEKKPLKGKDGNSFGAKVRALHEKCLRNRYDDLLESYPLIRQYGKREKKEKENEK